jgi:hypothetical protein
VLAEIVVWVAAHRQKEELGHGLIVEFFGNVSCAIVEVPLLEKRRLLTLILVCFSRFFREKRRTGSFMASWHLISPGRARRELRRLHELFTFDQVLGELTIRRYGDDRTSELIT